MEPVKVHILGEAGWEGLAGITRVAFEEYRSPIEIGIDGIRQALAADIPDPPTAYFNWPRQYGKGALTTEFVFDGPNADVARAHFEALFALAHAAQEQRLDRLSRELGIPPSLARHQFEGIQRVLERTGIADGYGNLTVPQPVRPPIALPAVLPPLVRVYPDLHPRTYPLDHMYAYLTDPPGTVRPLIMRSFLPARPAPPA
ncbi:hypothetical protein [Streptomyces sp. NBC_00035]|uniref:hypothetical protein n=1 Tax=Streptomyces sp. NBC_00035 TaxID=2903614 RepID=UPI00324F9AA9